MASCKKTIEFIKHGDYYEIYMAGDEDSGISVVGGTPKELVDNLYSYIEDVLYELDNKK